MEVEGVVPGIGGPQPICLCNSDFLRRLSGWDLENVRHLLDAFGKKSAAAQGLGAVVTDIFKLKSTDQRLYLHASRRNGNTIVNGGLKIGTKKLFVIADDNSLQEISPTCVLDFYVHESCQRKGIGKELFEHFLATEKQHPGNVAYDRPSPKLLAFLSKHYGLRDYIPQNNNFVVFNTYWRFNPPKSSNRHSRDSFGAYNTYSGARMGAPLTSKTTSPLQRMTHTPLTDYTNTSRPAPGVSHPSLTSPTYPTHQAATAPGGLAASAPLVGSACSMSGAGHVPVQPHHEPHLQASTSGRLRVSVPPNPFESSSPSYTHTFHPPHPPLSTSHSSHHSGGSSPSAPPTFPLSPPSHPHHPPPTTTRGDSLDRFRADIDGSGFPTTITSPTAAPMQHAHAHSRGVPPTQGGPVPPFAVAGLHSVGAPPMGAPTSARMPPRYASPPHAHSSASSPGFPPHTYTSHAHHPHASRFASRPPWGEYYAPHTSHPFQPIGAHSASGKLHAGGGAAAAGTPLGHAHALQQQPLAGVASPGAAAGAGASVSKAAARAQRSGAGAASCLVW